MNRILFRIIVDILLIVLAVLAPWWITFIAAIIAALYFELFIELLLTALFLDSLYGVEVPHFYNAPVFISLASCIIFEVVVYVRNKLLLY